MEQTDRHTHLPELQKMSLTMGLVMLMLALARFINIPTRTYTLQLTGVFYVSLPLGVPQLVAPIIAILAATGADWLLRSHPHLGKHTLIEHWLLPGVTALAIALALLQLPVSPAWWLAFALGGSLLMLVLLAEYISIDQQDLRQPLAAYGLSALAFALFLLVAATLRFTTSRLSLILPLMTVTVFLVSLRTLRLRHPDEWFFIEAGLAAMITVMVSTALHYWPISPVSFGLALLGLAYSLTTFFNNLADDIPVRKALLEPLVVLIFIWLAAALLQ